MIQAGALQDTCCTLPTRILLAATADTATMADQLPQCYHSRHLVYDYPKQKNAFKEILNELPQCNTIHISMQLSTALFVASFNLSTVSLRFAGGEGAQRRSGRRIFGTRPKGRTPRTGRSVSHTWHSLYQQKRLNRRVSGGAVRYKHDHAPGAEEMDRPK